MCKLRCIGLLGGTFDPVHNGHLRLAQALAEALALHEVRFIPAASPPHKAVPQVTAEQRAHMVELAIADNALFKLDTRELSRVGPSYTIDTLIALRQELGHEVALMLLMGSDAFVHLASWHRWRSLLDYAHIVLVARPNEASDSSPGLVLSAELQEYLSRHYTENIQDLQSKPCGYIHKQNISALDISATSIRDALQQQKSVKQWLPQAVLDYIQLNALYA
jgi:nicotinate-nucleotide adenylyltransferase